MTFDYEKNHAEIKKQIKEWEKAVDEVIRCLYNEHEDCVTKLEGISHEMMAINM